MSINKKVLNATVTEFDGTVYKSKLEARVAKELDAEGIAFSYESTRFELIPKHKYLGETVRAMYYTPDFICGNVIIEVKGFPNDRWPVVRKLIINKIITENLDYKFYEIHSVAELRRVINVIKNGDDRESN